MEAFRQESLEIAVQDSGSSVRISWQGASDLRKPNEALAPYLGQLGDSFPGRSVHLHFEALEYMNSASVTTITEFVKVLSRSAKHIVVYYRNDLQWQATSFRALRILARNWNNVEIVGRDSLRP